MGVKPSADVWFPSTLGELYSATYSNMKILVQFYNLEKAVLDSDHDDDGGGGGSGERKSCLINADSDEYIEHLILIKNRSALAKYIGVR